jgi:hypothetical protein
VEERVFIEGPEQQRIPDFSAENLEVEHLEFHQHYIEILDRHRDLKVVTVIEVISPSTKTPGPGRNSYEEKRKEILATECHLVEIDLLRHGRHVTMVPEARVRAIANCDYLINVNRWPDRKRLEVYPGLLRSRLPRIRIPLADPDPDVPLDLQTALEQVYEDGSYMLRVRHDEPCEPPLPPTDQQWANECWATYKAARPDLFPPSPPAPGQS